MTAITRFRGAYAFLSNFYSSPIEVNGITFPTVEHAFQAAKLSLTATHRVKIQQIIADLKSPADAKRRGREVPLRTDWKTAHLPIMRRLLALKFSGKLAQRLLDTGTLPLIEGNDWGDTYWGQCNGKGRNQLGVLLMELRTELRHEMIAERIDDAVEHERDVLNHCIEEDPRLLRYPDQEDASIQQALALQDAPLVRPINGWEQAQSHEDLV